MTVSDNAADAAPATSTSEPSSLTSDQAADKLANLLGAAPNILDNRKDEDRLFAGLEALKRHGVKPDHVMVYMLIGYWPGETQDDWLYRQERLRTFGARPYPMPFVRTIETVGFQRWCVGAYDKRVPWSRWVAARYQPRNLVEAGT